MDFKKIWGDAKDTLSDVENVVQVVFPSDGPGVEEAMAETETETETAVPWVWIIGGGVAVVLVLVVLVVMVKK